MTKETLDKTKEISGSTGQTAESSVFFMRPAVLAALGFIILACLCGLLIYQRYELVKEGQQKEAYEIVDLAKDKLQEALTHSLSATKTLTFFIDSNGHINNFESIAAQILASGSDIDALQLVPDGIIQYVYPLQGNEKVIGYNILHDPARSKEAYKAIAKKEMFFAGPFELRQGGMGVIGRLPVFRNNKFWGFSAVVIKMSTLYKTAGIDNNGKKGYHFQLSKINPDTKKEEFFLPQNKSVNNRHTVSVNVPDGEWKLSVTIDKKNGSFGDISLMALLGLAISVLGAVFIYRVAVRPQKLKELVLNRTSELEASETKYRSVIERVSDAFVALDKEWNYTYVNEKAGEIFDREPESLIGKNIWAEFPEGVNQPFYHAYYKAMELQEYQYMEEYYQPFDKWFENHIYPSKNGLTIFFKDVTDIKQIAQALKNNEEKYRSLIEQASDGIVITDMEGIILEVNNSIQRMIGYEESEMMGHHLTDYLPQEDSEVIPLRIKELMQGKSLLYERRLLKKDGTFVPVEVNSKMASSHTLIGFIRDITSRKKHENTLSYQAMLLESVSDAVVSLDVNRAIVSWNKASENLYGFRAGEAMGKRIPELVLFEFNNTTKEKVFEQVLAEGSWKGEFNFIHPKTGKKLYLLSGINGLKDGDNNLIGFIITSRDITEREEIGAALKASNERFELVAQATNDVIWDHDFIKDETWGNARLFDLYGLKPGDDKINFAMFMENIHPDARSGIEQRLKTAIENKNVSLSEIFQFKDAKGKYRTFFDRAQIKYDDSGLPLRILGAMEDITEREEAQKEISASEEKYRTIIEQAADGIFIADSDTYLIEVNSAGCRLSGYSKEELRKLRFVDVIPAQDLVANPVLITQMKNGQSVINERRLITKGGTIIDVEISAQKLLDGRYQIFARDIGERKRADEILRESEKKYKLLFTHNPQPMWMSTLPGLDIIDVNESAVKQYGYSREEFLKLNLKDLRPLEDVAGFLDKIENIDLGLTNSRQWRHQKKDGTIIQVEVITHEIVYEGKKVWLSSPHDVTEEHLAKELLQKSFEDIRQLASNLQSIREDERTKIAREIHDELGQQLTGLKMDIHWLSKRMNTTDKVINDKVKQSIELINATIVSVRKISTDLRPSILDDLGIMAALEWQGEEFEKRSGIRVKFNNQAGEILLAPDAATTIFRIYQESLTNVARHANAASVNVNLYKEDSRLFFSISDDGSGFDLETISKKKTLGLLGIKERTLLLNGSYEFKSKPGHGSETIISIPIQ
jgi:PAS domain S-box-containing protein